MKIGKFDGIDITFGCSIAFVASLMLIPLFVIFATCTVKCTTGIDAEYSRGEKVGVVFKVTESGYFWKTHEGEMNLGGMVSTGDGMSVNVWNFSVTDPSVLERLKTATENGEKVVVKYTQPWLMTYRVGNSGYLVTSVKEKQCEQQK